MVAAAGIHRSFFVVIVILAASLGSFSRVPERAGIEISPSEKYIRTELYFGLSKRDGTEVTSEEWKRFVDEEVTPRFPDGLTVVDAAGQFRMSSGEIAHEKSRMLILLYKKKDRQNSGAGIEAIRKAYCKKFDQESVMRVDLKQPVEVSFEE